MRQKLLPLIIMFVFGNISVTAQPTTAPTEPERVMARVYDISDLIAIRHNYPAPGPESAGQRSGRLLPAESDAAQRVSPESRADQLIKLISDTTDPESWETKGGQGVMRILEDQLIVAQTTENHQRIAELLAALRADRGQMIVIRAYWLMLDPGNVPPITSGETLPTIDDSLIQGEQLYCGAQTTCFSGQTVHVISGLKRSVVSGLVPVVGSNAVGYQPEIDQLRSGVVVQLTPRLEPGGPDPRIVLDVHSSVTEVAGGEDQPLSVPPTTQMTEPSDSAKSIDRINETNQELRTTVRIPLARKVLIGGMTLQPAQGESGQQLYLVVEANAVK